MLKSQERSIEGLAITVTQFAGRKNLDLLVDLASFVGPAIAAAVPKGGGLDSSIDVAGVAQALTLNLDKGRVGDLVMRLLSSTFVDGRELDTAEFDRRFAGVDIWNLVKILTFVIEVNYGNFTRLGEIVSKVPVQPAKVVQQAQAD